jgi:hypothetical protein
MVDARTNQLSPQSIPRLADTADPARDEASSSSGVIRGTFSITGTPSAWPADVDQSDPMIARRQSPGSARSIVAVGLGVVERDREVAH